MILHALCEGVSQRATARVLRVDLGSVVKLFREAGDMAIAFLADVKDLTCANIQADELHSFINRKGTHKRDDEEEEDEDVVQMVAIAENGGVIWTYLAVDVRTKLIVAYHLGDRGYEDAKEFASKLARKLKRNHDGTFATRPTIVTDGLTAYKDAFGDTFHADMNFAMFVKKYSKVDKDGNKLPSSRYQGADRRQIVGKTDDIDVNTWAIERQNLNVRMQDRRYTRRSNGFSKKLLDHERQLALWILYHNYVWIPRPSRPPNGSPPGTPWTKRLPAAMAAGIEHRLWEISDFVALTEAFVAERAKIKAERLARIEAFAAKRSLKGSNAPAPGRLIITLDADDVVPAPSHWVYRSNIHKSTKVHEASCSSCRDGAGRRGSRPGAAEWLPFYSLAEAVAIAEALSPERSSICSLCIGEYRQSVRPLR